MTTHAFTPDENGLTLDGHRYVAKETDTPGRCKGCAFPEGFGCRAVRQLRAPSMCQAVHRQDGRSIVWVPSTQA